MHPGLPARCRVPARRPRRWRDRARCRAGTGCRVVPRGAGSGVSGGAIAVDGALTVVITRMDRILEIDSGEPAAVVQPGVINADLGRAVAEHGLFYPPDPASFEICTIGGNLAENSGGLRCVKYGVTRDCVLGLEVVLADGAVIRTGGSTVKDVTGYDLTHLFVGSEGTLGIITEATLRLLPMPPRQADDARVLPDASRAAGEAVAGITAAGVVAGDARADGPLHHPRRSTTPPPRPRPGGRRDADDRVRRRRARRPSASWTSPRRLRGSRRDSVVRARRRDRRPTGCARRAARRTARSSGRAWRAWTTSACRAARIPEMLAAIERIAAAHGLPVGRLRPRRRRQPPPDVRDRPRRPDRRGAHRRRPRRHLRGRARAGRHDHRRARHRAWPRSASWSASAAPARSRLMRAIKDALDPLGILNPGKVFEPATSPEAAGVELDPSTMS